MTRDNTAQILAKAHYGIEPNMKHIFLLEALGEKTPDTPIALLEVVDGALECGVEPIAFAPDPANRIDYPSIVIEVSPSEYKEIQDSDENLKSRGWIVKQELMAS